MRAFSLKKLGSLFVLGIFCVSIVTALTTNVSQVNAATTYAYAENGAKIVMTLDGGKTYSLVKNAHQNNGAAVYEGSIAVDGPNNASCALGLKLFVQPSGPTSGTISAPAESNGLDSLGVANADYVASCPRDFAAKSTEYNKSITIATVGSATPAPANPETTGGKEGVVTAYSKTLVKSAAKITQSIVGQAPVSNTKSIDWSTSSSTGSARWEDLVAGTNYQFCISPAGVFDTVTCKTGLKEYNKTLQIEFGTFETSYNPTGTDVNVTVHMKIPAAPTSSTYGPIPLTIYRDGVTPVGTGEAKAAIAGNDVTVAQTIILAGVIQSIQPSTYKVCITNDTKLCSASFTKEVNLSAKADISISEADAKAFLVAPKNTCNIDGIGWIICPTMSFMGDLLSNAFNGLADNFLVTDTSLVSVNSGTYAAWGVFRNIANVAFVIAFLIIIFSQLTGVGVSNYGVKKLLPRIVIAAILVNISYFVCQIAVDLSNILGYSLKSLLDGISSGLPVPGGSEATASNGFGIVGIVAIVLGLGVAGYFALGILVPVLITALLGVIAIVLLLIARKAIIILLIALSPLAFVAFLLPNTESLFNKWRKVFVALLLLFPIISMVFGMSSLAAKILLAAGPGTGEMVILQIIAVGVGALPFFLVPTLLKSALDGIGTVGAKINSIGSKAGGALSKQGTKAFNNTALARGREIRKQARSNYRNQKFATSLSENPHGLRAKVAHGLGITGAQKYANDSLGRAAVATAAGAEKQEVNAAEQSMLLQGVNEHNSAGVAQPGETLGKTFREAMERGDVATAKAAQNQMFKSNAGRTEYHTQMAKFQGPGATLSAKPKMEDAMRTNINENHGDMKRKDVSIMKYGAMGGALSDQQLDRENYRNLSDSEMAGQSFDNVRVASSAGFIDKERAARMLANPSATDLALDVRTHLENIARGIPEQTSTNNIPPVTGGSGPGGLVMPGDPAFNVPHDRP